MSKQPNWLNAQNIQKVFKLLAQNNGEGRIVGGAVRDHLMGVEIGDIDFCSTHRPEELIKIAKNNKIRYVETGVKYGTVTLILDGKPFEVTSLRQDVETDGRHAKVIYGTDFKQDAMRRDFTINALYIDAQGKIYDPLGSGLTDLRHRKIKFIGNAAKRIEEDYLRILRYFRFIARFGFEYEQADFTQIKNLVSGLDQLSAERLLAEIKGIYQGEFLIHALQLMAECEIFNQIFKTQVSQDRVQYLQENRLRLKNIWLIRFRLSLPNLSIETAIKRLKPSNKHQKILNQMNQLPEILQINQNELSKLIYQNGKQMIAQNLVYFAAETNFDFATLQQKLAHVEQFDIPTFPINGADLFAKGFKAGPEMGQKIKQLENLWLSSDFSLTKWALLKAI